jgi:hypothetical protein
VAVGVGADKGSGSSRGKPVLVCVQRGGEAGALIRVDEDLTVSDEFGRVLD